MHREPDFIHLRVKTEYSLLEGAVRVGELGALCRKFTMPAIGVADTNNLFGALETSEKLSANGIQHIVGMQLDIRLEPSDIKTEGGAQSHTQEALCAHLVFFAQNEVGYKNLMWLGSHAYKNAHESPSISLQDLNAHSEGILCLTGARRGVVECALERWGAGSARALIERLKALFAQRLYVELQRHPHGGGEHLDRAKQLERQLIQIAYEKELPLVATNDVHFVEKKTYDAHDALICIADGAYVGQDAPRRRLTPEHYFKSAKEMSALFADLPEALTNSVEIARRCAFRVPKRPPSLPKFSDNEEAELRRDAQAGLEARLEKNKLIEDPKPYFERLEYELKVIEDKGYTGYFMIVADFIKWARAQSIPVGPGRGSGAGSLVAYALTITDIDPLRYELYFERFLNPERMSMPDFDIDFCVERRGEVIAYVREKYGHDKVAQIITFGALLSKMVVRDIARVLEIPYGQADRIAKMIPSQGAKPLTIDEALKEEPRLREEVANDESVAKLVDYGRQIEGLLRNASTHAAGLVIGERPLHELVPLYMDPRADIPATQFDMKGVEKSGLVKFDFLGLKNLTAIERTRNLLLERGVEIDIGALDFEDEKTYALLSSARTIGVFQLESAGMIDALRQLLPNCIEDIIALVALYRPGPMENIPQYCQTKHKKIPRQHFHPLIDEILDETYGIIIYQEQVMRIAQAMANYTLGEADALRRAMGKKEQAVMEAEKPRFFAGARDNGISDEKISEIWELLKKFADYGFNKAHAAAYAVLSYQTAWLKANYTVEFMTALMNCDLNFTDKLSVYIDEARKSREMGGLALEVVAPSINLSAAEFTIREGKIIYGLAGLKNVGLEAMAKIEQGRGEAPFITLFDFARRVDLRVIGKRGLEILINAGVFDVLDKNRARLIARLDALIAYSGLSHDEHASSQVSLFGATREDIPEPILGECDDFSYTERLEREHFAFGFYFSGHPLDHSMEGLRKRSVRSFGALTASMEGRESAIVKMAGIVTKVERRNSARGRRFAYITLSDPSGQYEVMAFSETLEAAHDFLSAGEKIIFDAEAKVEAGKLRLQMRTPERLDMEALTRGMVLKIFVERGEALSEVAAILKRHRVQANGTKGGGVSLCLLDPALPGAVEIELGEGFASDGGVRTALSAVEGVGGVEMT